MYIRLYRKVSLLSRTEKRYLWLAEVNFRNCLSIIYMYTQSFVYEQSQNFVYRHKLQNFVYECVLSLVGLPFVIFFIRFQPTLHCLWRWRWYVSFDLGFFGWDATFFKFSLHIISVCKYFTAEWLVIYIYEN